MTQRIVPFLGYEDAAAAIEWLERAFGFTEDRGYASPRRLRETSDLARRAYDNPWVIDGHFVEVDDVEAHYERARAAGATILREPEDPGIGHRIYSVEDLEGHRWMFGEKL